MGGTLQVAGTQTGVAESSRSFSFGVTMGIVDQTNDLTLASGDNTVAVPAGSVGMIVNLPSTNTNVVKLKGAAGDVGVPMSRGTPWPVFFDQTAPPTSVILNAAAAVTGVVIDFF